MPGTTGVVVNNFGDTRSGALAGPMGLFIILLLTIATVLLVRNMNARLRRLPDRFPDPADTQRAADISRVDRDPTYPEAERADVAADMPFDGPERSDRS